MRSGRGTEGIGEVMAMELGEGAPVPLDCRLVRLLNRLVALCRELEDAYRLRYRRRTPNAGLDDRRCLELRVLGLHVGKQFAQHRLCPQVAMRASRAQPNDPVLRTQRRTAQV